MSFPKKSFENLVTDVKNTETDLNSHAGGVFFIDFDFKNGC